MGFLSTVRHLLVTFRGFASVAMPANCVLSAKIKVFREERSTTQEKTSNSAKPLLYAARFPCYTVRVFQTYYISVSAFYKCKSDKDKYKLDWRKYNFSRKSFLIACQFLGQLKQDIYPNINYNTYPLKSTSFLILLYSYSILLNFYPKVFHLVS